LEEIVLRKFLCKILTSGKHSYLFSLQPLVDVVFVEVKRIPIEATCRFCGNPALLEVTATEHGISIMVLGSGPDIKRARDFVANNPEYYS